MASWLGTLVGILVFVKAILASKICIVGAGIGGSSLAYFLTHESSELHDIYVFEKSDRAGGRARLVEVDGEFFEAGASIAHEKNLHLVKMAAALGLETRKLTGMDYGIWDGSRFVYRQYQEDSRWWPLPTIYNIVSVVLFYGGYYMKLLDTFIQSLLGKWMHFYDEYLPAFETPEDMLRHAGLLPLTKITLAQALHNASVSNKIIDELVTAVIRIQYGQSAMITALPGAVGLCGTGSSLWQVKGGNFQLAEGLLRISGARVLFNSTVTAIEQADDGKDQSQYSLTLDDGSAQSCDAVAVAVPLVESGLQVTSDRVPPLRPYHHTHVTFVKGKVNATYFGYKLGTSLPGMIGTTESGSIPFSSISRQHSKEEGGWPVYKVFSREELEDEALGTIFSEKKAVIRLDWAAYPSYSPPESFAPFLLDDDHLYYINTFEDAASAMEAVAVGARNVARLMLTRFGEKITFVQQSHEKEPTKHTEL